MRKRKHGAHGAGGARYPSIYKQASLAGRLITFSMTGDMKYVSIMFQVNQKRFAILFNPDLEYKIIHTIKDKSGNQLIL